MCMANVVFVAWKVFNSENLSFSYKARNAKVVFAEWQKMKKKFKKDYRYLFHIWSDKTLKVPSWIGHATKSM